MQFKVMNEKLATSNYGCSLDHILIGVRTEETYKVNYESNKNRLDSLLLVFADMDSYGNVKILDDESHRDTNYEYHTIPIIGEEEPVRFVIFNDSLADQVLDFYLRYKDKVKLMIVQCEAGWSRSPGIAAALSIIDGGSDAFFFKRYEPNIKVYRTLLDRAVQRGLL